MTRGINERAGCYIDLFPRLKRHRGRQVRLRNGFGHIHQIKQSPPRRFLAQVLDHASGGFGSHRTILAPVTLTYRFPIGVVVQSRTEVGTLHLHQSRIGGFFQQRRLGHNHSGRRGLGQCERFGAPPGGRPLGRAGRRGRLPARRCTRRRLSPAHRGCQHPPERQRPSPSCASSGERKAPAHRKILRQGVHHNTARKTPFGPFGKLEMGNPTISSPDRPFRHDCLPARLGRHRQ